VPDSNRPGTLRYEDVSTRGVYSPLALVFFKVGAATASRCEGGKLATGILASWVDRGRVYPCVGSRQRWAKPTYERLPNSPLF
jgi:hypothetical protein